MTTAEKPDRSTSASATPSSFAVTFRGYDQQQVDKHIEKLGRELKETARSRDEATATAAELSKSLSYTQQELSEAKSGLARMAANPTDAAAMSERVRSMMQLAEEEIDELRRHAEDDAASVRAKADKYDKETRDAAQRRADETTTQAREDAEELANQAAQERDRLDTEAARRREEAANKAEQEATATREAAEQAATEREQAAEQAATEREQTARQRAEEMLADAERQLAEASTRHEQATRLKQQVTERLSATDTALQEALRELAPLDDTAVATDADRGETAKKTPSPKKSTKDSNAPGSAAKDKDSKQLA